MAIILNLQAVSDHLSVGNSFALGVKVQSSLGASGVVEAVDRDKDGQVRIFVRWKTGVLGSYNEEEVRRYEIKKSGG